jgi:biopolymer transport protein ExbD
MTALYFISEGIDSASFAKSQSEIMKEFQVSPKKLVVIWIRKLPLLVTVSLLNQIQKQSSRERRRDSITYKLNSRLKVDRILISSDKVKSVNDIIGLIDILARAGNRKLLSKRFAAWHRILEPILKSLD